VSNFFFIYFSSITCYSLFNVYYLLINYSHFELYFVCISSIRLHFIFNNYISLFCSVYHIVLYQIITLLYIIALYHITVNFLQYIK
jgi:hypothetical protein